MEEIIKWSNPEIAQENAYNYLGSDAHLYLSNRKGKKFKIIDMNTNKFVHFGSLGYEDYTKHNDIARRNKYLARATKIKGDWKDNPYSPNILSLKILWNW